MKVLFSFACLLAAALPRLCIIVQVPLIGSLQLPELQTRDGTAKEQESQPLDISLITQSRGFSLGLSIPRVADSLMQSPVAAVVRGNVSLVVPDTVGSALVEAICGEDERTGTLISVQEAGGREKKNRSKSKKAFKFAVCPQMKGRQSEKCGNACVSGTGGVGLKKGKEQGFCEVYSCSFCQVGI